MRLRLKHKLIYLVVSIALSVWTYSFYALMKMKLTEKAINIKLQETLNEMAVLQSKLELQESVGNDLDIMLDQYRR